MTTTTNAAGWPWASRQLFAETSSSPSHLSIFFHQNVLWSDIKSLLKTKSILFSLSKAYPSILGRNLDCHSKVSLQFYPVPSIQHMGDVGVNWWLQHWWCAGPVSHLPSPQEPVVLHCSCWVLSVCVLGNESCLSEHIKTFSLVSYDECLFEPLFPSIMWHILDFTVSWSKVTF